MQLFPQDADFTIGTVGFDDTDTNGQPYDLLDRKAVGERLSELLERINQPLVVALDGGWGSGKSHFLKLWAGAHTLENKGTANVIYFDAFEHDYLDDPLISLVGAIVKTEPKGTKAQEALKTVKKTAMKLARPAARVGLGLLTGGITEVTGAVVDEGIKAAGKSTEKTIDDFWKKEAGRTAAMSEFRAGLQALTEAAKDGTPRKLIFIIDELDRCRPDYALTLLEIIKHFFAVPNVHFVLGTNLTELENSVRARYGAGIGATQYLQKFVHLVMQFPKELHGAAGGSALIYFDAIVATYTLPRGYNDELRETIRRLAVKRSISLRDIKRLLTYAVLLPPKLGDLYGAFTTIICGALLIRALDPNLFAKLRSGHFEFGEIEKALALVKPTMEDPDAVERAANLDWLVWRHAISSGSENTSEIPEEYKEFARDPFGRGRRIQWENIEHHFATAFDTYSLPTQP